MVALEVQYYYGNNVEKDEIDDVESIMIMGKRKII
jgi:hypothetical protein